MNYRLGILATHPIQYYAPWFRYLAKRLDIEVFYAHRQDARGQAEAGFGVEFDWDVPLLDGYPYRWLTNVACRRHARSFSRFDTPEIYDIIRRGRFDAFLVFGWNHKSAIQTIRACWRVHVPVLMRSDSHLVTKRSWARSAVKYLPYRWFLPRLDGHLYAGKRNKTYLEYYGVPAERLFFVPHFVDNGFFAERAEKAGAEGKTMQVRLQLGIPQSALVFLFVGKMNSRIKRPGDFLQACLKIFATPEGSDIHALFVGDGPLRACLERLARPYASRIHFAGFRNQTEVPAFYKASDALILPSGTETWGLVVNEAFACGIPAIISDACGCAPDMIDEGLTGYTYRVGDVEGLGRRMLELKNLSGHRPAAVLQALTAKVTAYSMETATIGLESALDAVASRRPIYFTASRRASPR